VFASNGGGGGNVRDKMYSIDEKIYNKHLITWIENPEKPPILYPV
jgi:hypothetical protein